jgi:putative SOS response-associated peptidase YedK
MSVAGIWETWKPGTPRERSSFSILTTAANETMRDIHDRMPVILGRADENEWLDPEIHEPQELQRLMKPCPGNWLETVEVSTLVNSSKNDTAAVLAPIQPADRKQQLDLFH